jgi:hypothetical protein
MLEYAVVGPLLSFGSQSVAPGEWRCPVLCPDRVVCRQIRLNIAVRSLSACYGLRIRRGGRSWFGRCGSGSGSWLRSWCRRWLGFRGRLRFFRRWFWLLGRGRRRRCCKAGYLCSGRRRRRSSRLRARRAVQCMRGGCRAHDTGSRA